MRFRTAHHWLGHMLCVFALIHGSNEITQAQKEKITPGADVLLRDSLHLLQSKRVGVITNHTALLSSGTHLIDALHERGIQITAIFSPEHGFRGTGEAGKSIANERNAATGIPIYSLYGDVKKPTERMLHDVDVLIFDLQDIGARFYTYISTMYYAMHAAAENKLPFIILDRPNPITGRNSEGPVCEKNFFSFVGVTPIPIVHGMTIGEIGNLINEERWLDGKKKCNLRILPMKNWKRNLWFDETGVTWTSPSPNMKSLATATVYPGTCLIEGTNISEGRGTERPFEYIGAPFLDGKLLAEDLNRRHLPGVEFREIRFIPRSLVGIAQSPKFENEECSGVEIIVTNRNQFQPVATGIHILHAIIAQADSKVVFNSHFDHLAGNDFILTMLKKKVGAGRIIRSWEKELNRFLYLRKKYLVYR